MKFMEEKSKIENPNDIELIHKNNSSIFKTQRNKIILIIGCLLIICILFLSCFLLIDKKIFNKIDANKVIIMKMIEDNSENICEIGEEEKCLECDSTKKFCSICNPGYKLVNGKCIVNYSFKATYYSNSDNSNITLINSIYVKDIIEISFNNKKIPVSQNYMFPFAGN